MAARDAIRMAHTGEALLDMNETVPNRQIALAAAMLGRLASNDAAGVVQIYDAHKDLFREGRMPAEVRLMLALAQSHREINTTEAPRTHL
jgi:hypothetical protein